MTKPYYQDKFITLYNNDCKEILPFLKSESVDIIVSDPPYGMAYKSNHRIEKDDPLKVRIEGDENLEALEIICPDLNRILKDNSALYFFAKPELIGENKEIVTKYWALKNVIIWDKGDRGTAGDLQCSYSYCTEAILYLNKGKRKLETSRPRAIYRMDWTGTMDPVHPAIKPRKLMSWLIKNSSKPGDLILDPFAGTSPALLAAKALGRRAIGIEINPNYCQIAAERLSQESFFEDSQPEFENIKLEF